MFGCLGSYTNFIADISASKKIVNLGDNHVLAVTLDTNPHLIVRELGHSTEEEETPK